jgi:transposase
MYLLMDNARIHHSRIVVDYMNTTNHKIIYNVPYCPEFNPIELIFSKFKAIIRKKDNSIPSNMINNINKSFMKITKTDLINCYNHSLNF